MFMLQKLKCYVLLVFVTCLFRTWWLMEVMLIFVVGCNLNYKWGAVSVLDHSCISLIVLIERVNQELHSASITTLQILSSGGFPTSPTAWEVTKFAASRLFKIKSPTGFKKSLKIATKSPSWQHWVGVLRGLCYFWPKDEKRCRWRR